MNKKNTMRTIRYTLSFVTLLIVSFHVQSQNAGKIKFLPTKLRVTVLDGNGNQVKEATVSLFENESDYINSENPIKLDKTDKKGRVVFVKMEPKVYFMDVRKDDQNNDGRGSKTGKLKEGRMNKLNVVIE